MNSLVAYDDSDSEPERAEDGVSEVSEPSQSNDFNQNSNCMKQTHIDQLSLNKSGHTVDYMKQREKYPAHDASVNILPMKSLVTSELISRKFSLYSQKRPLQDTVCSQSAVRPYIPKRLRQEQSVVTEGQSERAEQQNVSEPSLAQNIFRVSDYLKPYLYSPYKSTEVPKNLVFQMCEHMAAVNRVQWCPVQQYSHLLLSASMDNTLKIWDAVDSGQCLKTYSMHRGAVRDAQWSSCGQKVLSGGFDSMLYLSDVETGKILFNARNEFKVGAVRFHPSDPNVFICGGFSPALEAWDIRSHKVIRVYKDAVQQHLAILFLHDGKEFVSSTDAVSRDSADRTIIAWDFSTGAKISNQIFHERYTCPSLTLHPRENVFVAQTNGNYMALFSSQRPYKINKKKRFEGHKVEGFAVECEFSPDGSLIVTGSSEGTIVFYSYPTSRSMFSIPGDGSACVSVTFHPVLPSLLASSYWDGSIRIWQ
ncbi:WD repeat-containing protein 25 [Discoglossus pictus]